MWMEIGKKQNWTLTGAVNDGASCNRLDYDGLKPAFRTAVGFSPRRPGFIPWAVHVKLLVDKNITEMGFSSGI
jgi:hypothetical protein